jgi:diguanylate cyclase
MLFIDLDGFKQVNDSLGHRAGDAVLVAVADRLVRVLRAGDTVARLGGDEFAVVAKYLTGPADAHTAAERIVHAVEAPIDFHGQQIQVSASVGIALSTPDTDADTLLHDADDAMYQAKIAGKNRYIMAGHASPD